MSFIRIDDAMENATAARMMGMTPIEDAEFTDFLLQKADEAQAAGYFPKKFRGMLHSQGGDATVRQLLAMSALSDGLEQLTLLGRLDLSVEALVVETKWRLLFDPALVRIAERRLTQCGYEFTQFPESVPTSVVTLAPENTPARQPVPRPLARPSHRTNTQSFSDFCAFIGAPLANRLDRWCGYNEMRGFAVFTMWADYFDQVDRYVFQNAALQPGEGDTRIGSIELRKILRKVMTEGHLAYGIRCEPRNPHAEKRERGYFDEDQLLVLDLKEDGSNVIARVLGVIPAAEVAAGRFGMVTPFDSAIDDIGPAPRGNAVPAKTAPTGGMGYRRDEAVRKYVIRRSGGRCEYCGVLGFEMADGSHYVEAHHVIALSEQGPDTVENVIALCPQHHREAHYGKQADALESELAARLKKIAALS